jgi:CubicO group peptidase (beta-lactamase class C family)
MRLVQEGKLRLDEDVNATLQSWKIPENEFTHEQKVTLRRILSHTAGLNGHGFAGYTVGEPLPSLEQILNGEKPANSPPVLVDVTPGSIMRYSGGGYVVLRALLSDVTHLPFPDLMDGLVLGPAGMKHSTFRQPLPEGLGRSAATAYRADGQPFEGRFHIYPEMAPDGLWTTPSDLARFAIEVQNEYAGKSSKILSQTTVREMFTRQKDDHDLAFFIEAAGQKPFFDHDGANYGFFSELFAFKEFGGQGIVVMINGNNIRLKDEFIRAVAREYHWDVPDFKPKERAVVKVNSAALATYAGTYEEPELGKIRITTRDNHLYLDASGMRIDSEEMFPESETSFFIQTDGEAFIFKKDESGKVVKMIIQYSSESYEAKKTF